MKVNPAWSVFWVLLGVVAISGEGTALALNGSTDSFSAQVWFVLDRADWLYWPGLAAFGAGAAWLAVHFFGRGK